MPGLVRDLADEWGLSVGAAYQPSGFTSWTALATRADGTACVLKVRIPDEDSSYEGPALRHFGGRAAVALLAEDAARDALLLERCVPGTPLSAEPDDVAVRVVAETLRELWSPPREGHPFRRLADVAPGWPMDAGARAVLRDLLGDDVPEVVLHGDLHAANVLRAERRTWLAIDPKGLVGDPAFDAMAVVRDRATPDLVPRRLALVSEVLGVDRERVRAWTYVWCDVSAVSLYEAGNRERGDEFAAVAAMVAP